MTVSERIPFSGLLLPLQKGYTYSCDRRTTDGMELLFIFREDGRSRYYFESDMQEFDRKAASGTHILTVYPRPNGDGKVSLLHRKRAAAEAVGCPQLALCGRVSFHALRQNGDRCI